MTNELIWEGKWEIFINGKLVKTICNRVMNAALNELVKAFTSTSPDMGIAYLALGTGNTAVSDTDTTLDTEIFRTVPVLGPTINGTGEIVTDFVVLDTEAVTTIEEIGIFGGSSASAAPDTGLLISRLLWHKEKTNTMEIDFKRTDRLIRG